MEYTQMRGSGSDRANGKPRNPDENAGFTITGADGIPIEIPRGEFYFNTKARARRMMHNSLSADARRVYSCLELHTMGFQQEMAVIMDAGRIRPLTPADIAAETGLSPRYVRYSMQELEEQGLAERREIITDKGLINGNVAIYSWATPRQDDRRTNGEGIGSAQPIWPDWFPKSWESLKPLIKHRKLVVSIDEEAARSLFTEGEEAARAYQNALDTAARFLERVCARAKKPPVYKEETTKEPNTERTPPDGRAEKSSSVVEDPPEPPPARPPVGPPSKDSPLRQQLRAYLESKPVPTKLDEEMFERIARLITTPEQFEGFKQSADGVKAPRKWAIYATIAAQVDARGTIPKPPPQEDPLAERLREHMEKRRPWPT